MTLHLSHRQFSGGIATLCLALTVAGCAPKEAAPAAGKDSTAVASAPAGDSAMKGMDMGHGAMDAPVTIPAGADYTAADVHFMQGMIAHHAQALTMAAMAASHGASPSVTLFCKKIDLTQRDEITMMQTWLKDRKQTVTDANDPHPMMMPGMLTAEQLTALGQAHGAAFDRLFLTDMIQHHQGAISMVADLFASPGAGQASEMFRYASDVDADQRAEIDRMQKMLQTIKGS